MLRFFKKDTRPTEPVAPATAQQAEQVIRILKDAHAEIKNPYPHQTNAIERITASIESAQSPEDIQRHFKRFAKANQREELGFELPDPDTFSNEIG